MKSYGQIGYEAYRAWTGGVSLATGTPIPEWERLQPEIQAAWDAAGTMVRREVVEDIVRTLESTGTSSGVLGPLARVLRNANQ